MTEDTHRAVGSIGMTRVQNASMAEKLGVHGIYHAQCFDRDGNLKWEDTAPNLVTTVGKNNILDNFLAGSAFTQTGPYVGLISSVGYSALAASDTMSSHPGWTVLFTIQGNQ